MLARPLQVPPALAAARVFAYFKFSTTQAWHCYGTEHGTGLTHSGSRTAANRTKIEQNNFIAGACSVEPRIVFASS